MKRVLTLAALVLAAGSLTTSASAQTAAKAPDPALVDAYMKSTFGKAPPEWQARIEPDETLKTCNAFHNEVPSAEADKITARELARVVYPADGKFLGNWKEGAKIANNGRGGQFSDPPDTVAGGNCYACHQMEQKEVSYGTLGPSLTNYGKDRKYDPQEIKNAFTKVYDSQAMFACSNMPRFGVNKVLSEQQIKDIVAFLFDPESPVNK
ncbi:sulfur oxidation c-type cytochrome SoxX [Tardiphaga sp. 20_F10_N6_6]|jgi:sulfur-oxidizing protein SoxX|uniref:sulfur oxidation c-type cytochrome SoxX n=1 Tax=unclassified Tardiphaga TaxID=2631404 RepID=UPI002A5A4B48|nr:sulfur oxidation c-type cytochrome SoxX [Tardiphaga sp. 42S5]WPO40375.1 sulfur oxidation c-type cytochrome SoxX [Tardiphaga sp. 42S5]